MKYLLTTIGSLLLLFSLSCRSKQKKTLVTQSDSEVGYPKPVKLTSGPGYHWFGYYDKLQVDPTGRYVLGMKVGFEGRSPVAEDTLEIGMVDLEDNNKWITFGKSNAWGWQQGCMLQWRPGSENEVIWNDREGDSFVSRIYDIHTQKMRTLPKAIYTLSPDGSFALGTEFNRIQYLRPGYGYPGVKDPYSSVKAPKDIGIYKMDLETGENKLIISIADMAAVPKNGETLENYWNYFNHILVAPDNERFVFLHRYRRAKVTDSVQGENPFITRMFTSNVSGEDTYLLDPSGNTSHFIWNGNDKICAWTKPEGKPWGFYMLYDKLDTVESVGEGVMTVNGHNTYVPNTNNEWILNDTYPNDDRKQELYLYHTPDDSKTEIGKFFSPLEYKGEYRCDLHPRTDRDGEWAIFDSTHDGDGRQMYMVNIEGIINDNVKN